MAVDGNINIAFHGTSNFTEVQKAMAATAAGIEMQAKRIATARNRLLKTNGESADIEEFHKSSKAVDAYRAQLLRTVSAYGQFETKSLQVSKATTNFNEKMQREAVTLKDVHKNRKLVIDSMKEQQRLQRMHLTSFKDTADGRMDVSFFTPKDSDFRSVRNYRQEIGYYNQVLSQVSQSTVNWGKNTQWAGRQLTVGFSVPLGIAIAGLGTLGYQLDKQLVNITKVYGDASSEWQRSDENIRKSAMDTADFVAGQYGRMASDTLEIYSELAATGLEDEDLTRVTQSTARTALLGDMSAEESLKLNRTLKEAYRLNNDELDRTVNFFNEIENSTALTMQDISEGLPRIAGVMQATGTSIEDSVVLLAAFKEAGVDVAEGATALKSINFKAIASTKTAQNNFLEITGRNIEQIVDQADGEFLPVMQEIAEIMKGLDNQAQTELAADLFGIHQGGKALTILRQLGSESDGLRRAREAGFKGDLELAETAEREVLKRQQSISGRFDIMIAKTVNSLAELGQFALAAVLPLLEAIAGVIQKVDELSDGQKKWILIASGFLAVVGPVIMLAGLFANLIGMTGRLTASLIGTVVPMKILNAEGWAAEKVQTAMTNSLQKNTSSREANRLSIEAQTRALTMLNNTQENSLRTSEALNRSTSTGALLAPSVKNKTNTPYIYGIGGARVARPVLGENATPKDFAALENYKSGATVGREYNVVSSGVKTNGETVRTLTQQNEVIKTQEKRYNELSRSIGGVSLALGLMASQSDSAFLSSASSMLLLASVIGSISGPIYSKFLPGMRKFGDSTKKMVANGAGFKKVGALATGAGTAIKGFGAAAWGVMAGPVGLGIVAAIGAITFAWQQHREKVEEAKAVYSDMAAVKDMLPDLLNYQKVEPEELYEDTTPEFAVAKLNELKEENQELYDIWIKNHEARMEGVSKEEERNVALAASVKTIADAYATGANETEAALAGALHFNALMNEQLTGADLEILLNGENIEIGDLSTVSAEIGSQLSDLLSSDSLEVRAPVRESGGRKSGMGYAMGAYTGNVVPVEVKLQEVEEAKVKAEIDSFLTTYNSQMDASAKKTLLDSTFTETVELARSQYSDAIAKGLLSSDVTFGQYMSEIDRFSGEAANAAAESGVAWENMSQSQVAALAYAIPVLQEHGLLLEEDLNSQAGFAAESSRYNEQILKDFEERGRKLSDLSEQQKEAYALEDKILQIGGNRDPEKGMVRLLKGDEKEQVEAYQEELRLLNLEMAGMFVAGEAAKGGIYSLQKAFDENSNGRTSFLNPEQDEIEDTSDDLADLEQQIEDMNQRHMLEDIEYEIMKQYDKEIKAQQDAMDAVADQNIDNINSYYDNLQDELDASYEGKQKALDAQQDAEMDALDAAAEKRDKALDNRREAAQKAQESEEDAISNRLEALDNKLDQRSERISEAEERESERLREAHEAQSELLDDAQERESEALTDRWEKIQDDAEDREESRTKKIEESFESRIESVNRLIEAEQDAENKRQEMFDNEEKRIQRLAELYGSNIDLDAALRTGDTDEAARIGNALSNQVSQWNIDDQRSSLGSATEQRIQALEESKEIIDEEKVAKLEALQEVFEAEEKAREDKREAEEKALEDRQEAEDEAREKRQEKEEKELKNKYERLQSEVDAERAKNENIAEMQREALSVKYTRMDKEFDAQAEKNSKITENEREKIAITHENQDNSLSRQKDADNEYLSTKRENELSTMEKINKANRERLDEKIADNKRTLDQELEYLTKFHLPEVGDSWEGFNRDYERLVLERTGVETRIDDRTMGRIVGNRTKVVQRSMDAVHGKKQWAGYINESLKQMATAALDLGGTVGLADARSLVKNQLTGDRISRLLKTAKHSGGVVGDGTGHRGFTGKMTNQEELVLMLKGEGVLSNKAMELPGAKKAMERANRGDKDAFTGDGDTPIGGSLDSVGLAVGASMAQNSGLLMLMNLMENAANNLSVGGGGIEGAAGSFDMFGATQIENAKRIIAQGRKMGASNRDLQIGLMTAMQESTLNNYDWGDRDSVGLFQQRTSQGWGTIDQIMNPEYSARKFFEGLLGLGSARNDMSLTQAAQAVQRSAFPNAYAQWSDEAAAILEAFSGSTGKSMNKPGKGSIGDRLMAIRDQYSQAAISGAQLGKNVGAVSGRFSGDGMGWQNQWKVVNNALKDVVLMSAKRPGATTLSGFKSYHSEGRAIDFAGSTSAMQNAFNWIASHYPKSKIHELYYSPMNNRQIRQGQNATPTGVVRDTHWDHVHWAMKKGGTVPGVGNGDRTNVIAEPGEFIVPKSAAERNIRGLNALAAGYSFDHVVEPGFSKSNVDSGSKNEYNYHIDISVSGDSSPKQTRDIEKAVQRAVINIEKKKGGNRKYGK